MLILVFLQFHVSLFERFTKCSCYFFFVFFFFLLLIWFINQRALIWYFVRRRPALTLALALALVLSFVHPSPENRFKTAQKVNVEPDMAT